MRLKASLFLISLLSLPVYLPAQVFDLQAERVPMTELRGLARFHTGDDPDGKLGWASPGFDDSQWPLLRVDQPWSEQGYKSASGFTWYRFQIVVPPGHAHLGVYVPAFGDSYEIFVNGRFVAKYGGLPPNGRFLYRYQGIDPVFSIPDGLVSGSRPVQVALRLWHWPYWTFSPAGLNSGLIVGDAQLLEKQRDLRISENLRARSGWDFLFAASLLAFCAGLGLFVLRPGDYAYLWFAFSQLGLASIALWNSYPGAHAVQFGIWQSWNGVGALVYDICWPTFIVTFLKEPRRRLYWATVAASVVTSLSFLPFLFQWIPAATWILLIYLLAIATLTGFLLLIWIPARRGVLDARLLLGPQILYMCAVASQGVLYALEGAGRYSLAVLWGYRYNALLTWPFTFSVWSLAVFLEQTAVLAILILRFARTSREEEHHANELEAARTVQQVLVPDENPSIPGFTIQSVYKPAGQVGGDFFQILPTAAGGVLVVIGDVSGKGMPAAMTVSLLVGTVRTLAHYTHDPAEILAAMNRRMIGRSNGGFTTCLVLSVSSAGILTAANAGHIPPYLNGNELPVKNGLPIGIAAGITYPETTFTLPPATRLTLITDGVLEATDPTTKELFGFDRTAAISNQSAETIAHAAQQFGQEDDITVLTLTFMPVEAAHA
jgi:sigma-B regulation protein RsbU (phosphoserine phosphatase)